MSLGAWGDEGDMPANGRDTAVYQELVDLRVRAIKWRESNKNDFANDEQTAKAQAIIDAMDELSEELAEWKS